MARLKPPQESGVGKRSADTLLVQEGSMKRFGLVFLVLLLAFTGAAFASPAGLTVINQSGLAITATLTQTTALSQPMKANETYVFGPFPKPQYTLKISSPNVNLSKSFGPEIQYAVFRRAGQVFQIFVYTTPPPPPPTTTKK
jgi:hypothetical protein